MVTLEIVAELAGVNAGHRAQARKYALLFVRVVIRRGAIEILEDRSGGGTRVVVAAVLRQMALQPRERRHLALDAPVAGDEHAERIVESGCRRSGEWTRCHGIAARPRATSEL